MVTVVIMSSARDRSLPTGTVTFLFTDIEGSTRLLTELGDEYPRLLAMHNAILRKTVAEAGGVEVGSEGDAIFAVFNSAVDAVRAATEAQRALSGASWPASASVRVRMGLHTGDGRLGSDGYVGIDVHRAARIAAAGHGGQVLLSDATRVLAEPQLPVGVTLADLGRHRLKDLPSPERLWQLDIDGLQRQFPRLRSLDARPNNLPTAPTPLVGREEELATAERLLAARHLLTLTGPGGTGKTRLAMALAERVVGEYPDGAFFVPLQDARDRPAVAGAIAAALGVRESPGRDPEQAVRQYLAERNLLLVLDNFEQVVEAGAPLVADLVAAAPRLRVVVTSRAAVHVSGEQEFAVPPLRLPDPHRLPPLAALSQYEAVALFIERARAVRPDFAVTNETAPAVAEICSRLDGLPLAIELAAARVKLLSPDAILQRLDRRLRLLTGGGRDLPDRQRTLRGAVDWSYELLDQPEQRLFERLSVFAGGWTVEACEAVCNPGEELGIDTLDGLASLVDKSLVLPTEAADGGERFRLLHVIREFAEEKLEAGPDAATIRRRHAEQVARLVEEAEPELVRLELRRWQRRLRDEEDNVRAALRWAIDRGVADLALRTAGALWHFWHYWAELREGRAWLEAALRLPAIGVPGHARAKGLTALAAVVYWQGEAERAGALYEEALGIYRELGDDQLIAETLHGSAWAAIGRNDYGQAFERARAALDHYRRAGDSVGQAGVVSWLKTGELWAGIGGTVDDAVAATQAAIDAAREAGRLHDTAEWMGQLSMLYRGAGDFARATDTVRHAARLWHDIGNLGRFPVFMKFMAALDLGQGRPERAVRLAAAANRFLEELGGEVAESLTGVGDPIAAARAQLAPEVHARAVAAGEAMSLQEAIDEVMREPSEATAAADARA